METKLKFDCTCNGCRNYPRKPAQIWHQDQIKTVSNGYFFSPDTMRFFKSKIVDFKAVGISSSGIDSLAVIVSSKFGDDSPRHYEIVIVCPYGELWRDGQDTGELIKYDTLRAARKSKTWTLNRPAPVCTCHGCQLDRAGR